MAAATNELNSCPVCTVVKPSKQFLEGGGGLKKVKHLYALTLAEQIRQTLPLSKRVKAAVGNHTPPPPYLLLCSDWSAVLGWREDRLLSGELLIKVTDVQT